MIPLRKNDPRRLALAGLRIIPVTLIDLTIKYNAKTLDPSANDEAVFVSKKWCGVAGGLSVYIPGQTDLVEFKEQPRISTITLPESRGEITRDLYSIEFIDAAPSLVVDDTDKFEADLSALGVGGLRKLFTRFPTSHKLKMYASFLVEDYITEALVLYSGNSNSVESDYSGTEGYKLVMGFSGPLLKLDSESAYLTTENNQSRRDKLDTCFKYAHSSRDVKWGKK